MTVFIPSGFPSGGVARPRRFAEAVVVRWTRSCGAVVAAAILFGVAAAQAGDTTRSGDARRPSTTTSASSGRTAATPRPAAAARAPAARASSPHPTSAPARRAAPLDLAAVARHPSPQQTWIKSRIIRKIRPKAVRDGADDGMVTGSVGQKSNGTRAGKDAKPTPQTDPAMFCNNVVDAASDARLAWQMKELEKAEVLLRERIAEMEAKRAEYEKWLKLRNDFLRQAEDAVVTIYSKMRPESAALQLASMSDETAAALIAKLNVRSASRILDEMEPARAAHLTNVLAGMRRVDDGKADK
jgi:flagellar motility protein MotE (MotC chaperone)